jgi:isopenicillin N synthase-like dioxygenase
MPAQPPIIDIEGLLEGDSDALARVADAIRAPARDWGAFQVVGHGLSTSELARFEGALSAFFDLPAEVKAGVRRSRDNARGYYDDELTKNQPDWKEVFDYGADYDRVTAPEHSDGVNQWPELADFREVMMRHYAACERVGLAILRALCASLEVAPSTLDAAFEGHSSFVRLNRYEACLEAAPADAPLFPDEGRLGVFHHTDAGALTLIYQDAVPGLQIWHDDAFVVIEPVEGALIVHLADMLQVWSNDRYRSPLHRVIANPQRTRHSAPFFLNPSYDAICQPLPNLIGPGEPARYRPISWHHFRDQRSAGDYADYGEEIQIAQFRTPGT